ncbi:MAG: helix-turn-helix transcriptional regulator [Clostridium sp.]
MKIDRLISIINLLNNKGRMSTRELAEIFEVSPKTIQRDMEAIEMAGIPIVTYKGKNGGYEIIENFKVSKSVMNKDEAKILKKLLEGISVSYESKEIKSLNEKLSLVDNNGVMEIEDKLMIEFSHWGSDEEFKSKISIINNAIDNKNIISFSYMNLKGEELSREFEPYKLVYKGSNWYVYGYCLIKDDFRLFKIRRMKSIKAKDEVYLGREIKRLEFFNGNRNNEEIILKVRKKSVGLIEDMYEKFIILNDEGEWLRIKYSIPIDNWLYGMILSLGDDIEVVSPKSIRNEIIRRIKCMHNIYNS